MIANHTETGAAADRYPLTPLQQGMLFHHLAEPGCGTDIEQIVCTLHEQLDAAALRSAWDRTVERHEQLRTIFGFADNGDLIQIVQYPSTVSWQELDWRHLPVENQLLEFESFLGSDRRSEFNLHEAPPNRLCLIRTADAEYRMLWTFHHALLDGRSFPIVLGEVFAFYESIRKGKALVLPWPRRYRDYIDWLRSHNSAQSESYWRAELAGFTAPNSFGIDQSSGEGTQDGGLWGQHRITLDALASSALKEFAQNHGWTLNTVVQGAWALLLHRYSGDESVAFGAVRACRASTIDGAENMVGFFINTLPLRVRVNSETLLGNWLTTLRAQWRELRDHEHTPLVQIHKWSDVPHDKPMFDSIVMFENYELNERLREKGGSWATRTFHLYEQTGYPLTLTAYAGSELQLQIGFNHARFSDAAIRRMLGHLKTILLSMEEAGPDQQLKAVRYLTDREESQCIVEWNETAEEHLQGSTLHQQFEAQVKASPEAVAVVFGSQELTYLELNDRSNQLAHWLQEEGIGPEDLVGVCIERSPELIVAMLGVLKAGAAYVPLDPQFPAGRLAQIVSDSGVQIILTQRKLTTLFSAYSARLVPLDTEELMSQPREHSVSEVDPHNLAYVIFTSGSTGRPKGVQVEHRAVINFLFSMKRQPGIESSDILLAVTTFSFDIAALEIFLPLLNGARLVIADRESTMDCRRLGRLIEDSGATVMQATPATWRMLIEHGWAGRKGMKILCGGEALPPELARELLPRCSSLWNMYGPTETTIWSTTWQVTSATNPVPIGKPIANTQTYILDPDLNPVPVGVSGELFIGGTGVARGYWRAPQLTAERFLPNRFRPEHGGRMYRTGDICRWRSDGALECLGRSDQQVKVRGFRIELAEVEAALGDHPHVSQAVVVVQKRDDAEKRLVAYVVSRPGQILAVEELRNYLMQRLPDYMVPSAYMALDHLPQTANGKVDRKALPAIDEMLSELDAECAQPISETEKKIARVWSQVLGTNRVGRNSNFFNLGGDSLSILRVRYMLEREFSRELAVVELFGHPTIELLANFLQAAHCESRLKFQSRENADIRKGLLRRRLSLRNSRVHSS